MHALSTLTPTNYRRRIAALMLVAYGAAPVLATAQVVLNGGTPNDGRRAYVDQTQNGLPKVNIATPNGAGVSHNTYSDFNVGKQGLILNNATNNSNTALAGWVEGNPNLVPGQEAKMILNEVVGAKQSQLNGFIEVAGKKADVIVANENGITCNGCGFFNTTRGTLTTGTPVWGSGGQLEGLKIRQGLVSVGADGLSASDSRIDLLSQAINIQGAIHADRLNVVAGNNNIGYDAFTVQAATTSTNSLGSLDVSQLGGMYANQINLMATGAGVGVRVDGTLVSAGNIAITSEGQLTHAGRTSAQGNIQTQANTTTQSGSLVAAGNLQMTGGTLNNTGALVGQDVQVNLTGSLTNEATGTMGANANLTLTSLNVQNNGKLNAKGTQQITTGTLVNAGDIVADGALSLDAASLSNTGKVFGNSATATVAGALNNGTGAELGATNRLQITTNKSGSVENSGSITAKTLNLQTDRFVNLGTGLWAIGGDAVLNATTLNNLGRLYVEGQTRLDASHLNNAGQFQTQGGLTTSDMLSLQNSGAWTGGDVSLSTQSLTNTGRIEVQSLNLTAVGATPTAPNTSRVNNSGVIAADRVQMQGFAQVSNSNQISTDVTWASTRADSGLVQIAAGTLDNTGGRVLARGNLDVVATDVINAKSTLSSKGDMRILASQDIDNREGLVLHQGTGSALVQAARTLSNAKGQIEGQGQSLTVNGGDIDNSEGQILQTSTRDPLTAPSQLNVTATADAVSAGELRNVKGNISGTGNVTLSANALTTDASSAQLSSAGSLKFLDKSKATTGAKTASGGYNWEADIAASAAVASAKAKAEQAAAAAAQTAAALSAAQAALARLQADPASTAAAIAQAQSDVAAANTANQLAQAASLSAQNELAAAQAAVPPVNNGSSGSNPTQPGNNPADMTVPTPPPLTLPPATAQMQAGHNLSVNTGSGLLDNRQGKLAAANNLSVNAQGHVLAGQMQAGKNLTVEAKQLEVDQQVQSKNTKITADTLIVSGRVQGDDTLTIEADTLTNSGTLTGNATRLAGKTSATSLELGNTGMVQGNNSLDIQANRLLNQATLASGGDLSTTTATSFENQALIFSVGHQKHYGVDLVNNQGRIYALGDITLQGNAAGDNATSILNYAGRIEAQGNIDLRANTVTNRAVVPTSNARGIVEKISTSTQIRTIAKDTFNADGKNSEILAGQNLNIKADEINNDYGIISARLNATLGTRLLKNRSLGAIQTENMVVKAACFNCHQTVSYSETWGGVIAAGRVTVNATTVDNQTLDTRDGFAGLSTDPRVVIVDERSGTQSPLTRAFIDRFGIVNGPAASAAGAGPGLNLNSPKTLSDGLVLSPNGAFDFSHYVLPNGKTGLFEVADPASPYLIKGRSDLYTPATNGQYTVYNKFAGSDYLLTRLGLMPVGLKRLGDAWYETQLVQDQLYALTGRTHLAAGTDSDYDLMLGLMDAGLLAQAKFGLSAGDSLSAEQQATLTQTIVWPEWQVVNGQRVLVPKVYLAKADIEDNNKGARIVGTDVAITTRELKNTGTLQASNSLAINASGAVSGGGSYSGGKAVAIVADSVDLKHASIQSGGWLNIDTAGDMTLAATQIKAAGDARLSAGGSIALNAEKHEAHVVRGNGSSKDEVRYETTNVQSGGNLTIEATKNVVAQGSKLEAEGDFKLSSAQGNVDLQAVVDSENVNIKGVRGGGFLGGLLSALTGNTTQVEDIKGVQIQAGGNALVQATQGDVKAQSLQMQAAQHAMVVAGGAVALTSEQAYSKAQTGSDVRQNLLTERSQITGDKGVAIYGQKRVQLDAASIKASQGDVSVTSAGDVSLGFNTDTQQHNWTTSSSSGNILSSKTTVTQHETLDKTAQVTELEGQKVKVLGHNVKSEGAKLDGAQLVQVEGVNNTQLYAVQEVHQNTQNSQTSSSTFGFTYSKSSSTDSSIKSEALGTKLSSDEAIQVGVGAVTDVQGAILTAPQINFVRSAGADTSKDGQLVLGGSTNTSQTSHTEKTETAGVYQEMSGQGETKQTLNQTQINGKVSMASGINTTVMIPEGDFKNQVQQLSQQPGLAYMGELAKDPRINWQQVKLAYDHWSYSQEGLTPAGAAVLAIAVAVASGGSAASLVSSMGYSGATAAAMTAGLTTLASSAAVSFVNNGGDIGKTLKDMGSSQNIKGIALAMVSAGVLSDLNSTMGLDKVKVTDGFTANLNKALVNNLANATMTSAITGTSLEDNIKTGLVGAFISAGAGQTAYEIGNQTANDQMAKALAHAIAGCAAGAAGQGKGGCSAGAMGAVVGELAAQWYDNPTGSKSTEDVLKFVKVVAAAAGAMTSDGSAASVATASMTGVNAAQNNYLMHLERKQLDVSQKSCTLTGDATACNTATALKLKDELSDKLLANAAVTCKGQECNDVSLFIQKEMSAVGCAAPSACPDYSTLSKFWNVAQTKAQGLEAVYPEGWVMDAKAALDLTKLGIRVATGGAGNASLNAVAKLRQVDQATTLKFFVENNLYKDWPIATDAVTYRVNQLAEIATNNPKASSVVLGKYVPNSATSYQEVAKAQGATYFELPGQSWDNAVQQLGRERMWEVNKSFLDGQIAQGKSFVFTVDARKIDPTTFTYMEFEYLTSKGYKFVSEGAVFRAVKK